MDDLDLVTLTSISHYPGLCAAEDRTQGFVHTKKAFHQLNYIPSSPRGFNER